MSHFGDFMDGVPVKISEKYKRPPRIDLPHSILDCPMRTQAFVDTISYNPTFEVNVLSKIKELRSAKATKRIERRHRLQLQQEAKQNKLDAIAAAEAEERLKQLNVSEVSYPSTDEISALSPDDKTDKNCDAEQSQDNTPEKADVLEESDTNDINYSACNNPADSQLNILQPIQVQSNYTQSNLLDDPDPLQELKMSTKITKINYNSNVETLTFKDFENDTSSPFDNVELKTINDMELLAQVLQSQRDSTTSCDPQQMYVQEETYIAPNCAPQAQVEGMVYLPNSYTEQQVQCPNTMYSSPQHYSVPNGYYIATNNTCDNAMPIENMNIYAPSYQYYVPANQYPVDSAYFVNQLPNSGEMQIPNGTNYIPQPYYYQYPHIQYTPPSIYNNVQNQNQNIENNSSGSQIIKSRSRSVPDIVKELDEELASAKLRANERSNNASPAPKVTPQTSSVKKEERRSRKKREQLSNPFDKLSSQMQIMCQKIHGMGFPLDRVARMCTLVGENDKKVIDGLLILNELMDLGFSEAKVAAALAKHEFNRDKVLDELVS